MTRVHFTGLISENLFPLPPSRTSAHLHTVSMENINKFLFEPETLIPPLSSDVFCSELFEPTLHIISSVAAPRVFTPHRGRESRVPQCLCCHASRCSLMLPNVKPINAHTACLICVKEACGVCTGQQRPLKLYQAQVFPRFIIQNSKQIQGKQKDDKDKSGIVE